MQCLLELTLTKQEIRLIKMQRKITVLGLSEEELDENEHSDEAK